MECPKYETSNFSPTPTQMPIFAVCGLGFGNWGVYRTAVCSVRCSREKRRGIIASTTELKKISSLRGASQVLRIQPQAIRSTSSCIMTMLHDGLSIDVSNALSSSGGVGDCDPGGG